MRYVGVLATVLLASGAAPPVLAETGETGGIERVQARALFYALGGEAQIEKALTEVRDRLGEALENHRPELPPEALEVLDEEIARTAEDSLMGDGGLAHRLSHVYSGVFTPDEVAELVRFYQSELGRKVRRHMGQVQYRTSGIVQSWRDEVLRRAAGRTAQRYEALGIARTGGPREGARDD